MAKYSVIGFGLADPKYLQTHHPDKVQELRETGYRGNVFIFLDVAIIPGQISPHIKTYQRAIGKGINAAAKRIRGQYENVQTDPDYDARQQALDNAINELVDRHQPKAEGLVLRVNEPSIRLLAGTPPPGRDKILDQLPKHSVVLSPDASQDLAA